MSAWRRWLRFNGVSAMGIAVQLGVLALLRWAGLDSRLATPLAVTVTLAHNFLWHRRWTWPSGTSAAGAGVLEPQRGAALTAATAFLRFTAVNGAISLTGNTALTPLFSSALGWPILPSNLAAIAVCGILNYWLASIIVFNSAASLRSA